MPNPRGKDTMDYRPTLQKLVQEFDRQNLISFLRAAKSSFRPEDRIYSHFLQPDLLITDLHKVGQIEFNDAQRLIVVTGRSGKELTSHSGKRRQYDLAKKILKDELFDAGIFAFNDDAGHFRFSLVTVQYKGTKREFSNFRRYTYFVSADTHNRTFLDQIGRADFSSIENITQAFSVEPVTKEFYKAYEKVFNEAEKSITLDWLPEKKRLYTQKFFNRLMFLAFLERKGRMTFNGRQDYLRALFENYWRNDDDKRPEANFHRKRLNALFFSGLNNPRGQYELDQPKYKIIRDLIGDVPFLNGGLFEEEQDDEIWFYPDDVVAKILKDLLYAFNFTVTESTPLDVEVAVDPEMLGKIFEKLVTGRHETGSYYTPKPVVAFMCREALKGYLNSGLPHESSEAIHRFVDESDPAGLKNPEAALGALRGVRACDPACGSGAYLLGLLHELLELRAALFVTRHLDAPMVYDRKLEIIQNNLYGVDIDPFAVNIARLRLWLSLIVDFEGETPPPLPNLDFKIEAGDSLTAPDPSGGLQPDLFRYNQVQEYFLLKGEYMQSHGEQKKALQPQIDELRRKISEWAHDGKVDGFDWQVEFAEVFAPQLAAGTLSGKMAGIVNLAGGQMELTAQPKECGFDIVLANPPYVRQELIRELKPTLKRVYGDLYTGTTDLYVYFYLRSHQLLRPGGVACFISSNKWLRAGYGEKLRQHLLDDQAFSLVVDFGELPVFQAAATFPAIFLWKKAPRRDTSTKWAVVKSLQECYDEGIVEHITRITQIVPFSQFGKGKPRLATSDDADKRFLMDKKGTPLGTLIDNQIYFGIKTGLNEAFIIDRPTRDELIVKNPKSADILKPLLAGDDVRRYEIYFRDVYLIWTYIGVSIRDYPAIFEHLKIFQKKAEIRSDKGNHWWELRPCDYYDRFEKPKIIYPQIMMHGRFYLDEAWT